MHGDSLIEVTWQPRLSPLIPVGMAARGAGATRLAHRLMREPAEALNRLKGVGGPGVLVILGEAELLPWVDEVVYLGRDPDSSSLLIPTTLEPSIPIALFEQSLIAHAGVAPCALLLDPSCIVPLIEARPVARKTLTKWLEADL